MIGHLLCLLGLLGAAAAGGDALAKAKDEKSRQAMALLTEQARDLRTRVVAAGVSTAPQMASIWQFGVTLVQGNMVAEAGPRLDFDFRQYAG